MAEPKKKDYTQPSTYPSITEIDGFVINEIANRCVARNKPITPYVRITPGFSVDNTENSKLIFSGIQSKIGEKHSEYSFDDLYRVENHQRPRAGITSLSIEYLDSIGATRKAIISWVCHTIEDLEALSLYFLNPGMSAFVEWGWSNYCERVIDDTNDGLSLENCIDKTKEKIKRSNGNYDALLGIIVNYSFKLNKDGGFDCTTEVTSAGYLMKGITVPNQNGITTQTKNTKDEQKKENEKKEKYHTAEDKRIEKKARYLKYYVNNNLFKKLYKDIREENHFGMYDCSGNTHDYFIYSGDSNALEKFKLEDNKDKTTTVTFTEYNNDGNLINQKISVPKKASIFATWGYLEDYIITPNIGVRDMYFNETDENIKFLFGYQSMHSKISSHKYLRSTDLGVCIVPIPNDVGYNTVLPDFRRGESLKDGELDYGYVRRLLINIEYFITIVNSSTTFDEMITSLFSGINDACVNFWNFKLIPIYDVNYTTVEEYRNQHTNDYKAGTVPAALKPPKAYLQKQVIDNNYCSYNKMANKNKYIFRTKANTIQIKNTDGTSTEYENASGIIKSISFESKLSSQAALNVFFSAHNKNGQVMGTPSTSTFRSLYDLSGDEKGHTNPTDTFFGNYDIDPNTDDMEVAYSIKESDFAYYTEREIKLQLVYDDALTHFLPWYDKGYYIDISGKKYTGIEGMRVAIATVSDAGESPATSEAMVPLDLNIELEGISGLKIGDMFSIDHLPKIYQERGAFQIIGLSEDIDSSKWTTKIKSGFRVFNNDNYTYEVSKPAVATQTATSRTENIVSNYTGEDIKLSKHMWLSNFMDMKLYNAGKYPPDAHINNLKKLCTRILDHVWENVCPIKISVIPGGGYRRNPSSNPKYRHLIGSAADIVPKDPSSDKTAWHIFEYLAQHYREFKYHQLLLERDNSVWVHVSYNDGARTTTSILTGTKPAGDTYYPFDIIKDTKPNWC